ncbi:probable mitochondrial chaperone bcs1 [Phtheirospermum japonicum]|uniref:Probable mitochondrial chaperone bcs1 n=1 Tax=Phtheirospermum japonicum TaxID=374723 RepID=A0A830CH63_9LAMI|nr:probable mitochondrial chaperone bcs1 [Phtheirospermum japonicum]
MFLANVTLLIFPVIILIITLKLLSRTSLIQSLKKIWRFLEEKCYVYQFYRVPKFNDNMQENQLYRKVYAYLNSLPGVEDSDFANLLSSSKSTEINLVLDENQTIADQFLGARVYWKIENRDESAAKSLVMRIRKNDKRRILVPYLQHIHQAFDEIEQKRKEVRLYVNAENEPQRNGRWRSTPFTHPATMETIVMDADLKTRIKSDLESFLKSRQYYHRLGRVWKRSYLLYGGAGTGKSTFVAAMAKFVNYDIYEINLQKVQNDADLKYLLLQTTKRSVLVIEDLDRYLDEKSTAPISLSGILNFMDGLFSCCGEERLMVFTMNGKENVGACALRPGRVDVHIHFPLCDFTAFKNLANSHLGLKDHKLFHQVEEVFQNGAALSPAEIGEIMISNRGSPSRALKTVITALQGNLAGRVERRLSGFGSRPTDEIDDLGKDGHNGIHPMKEIKNLYGLLRSRSSRKASMDKFDIEPNERENSGSVHSRDN